MSIAQHQQFLLWSVPLESSKYDFSGLYSVSFHAGSCCIYLICSCCQNGSGMLVHSSTVQLWREQNEIAAWQQQSKQRNDGRHNSVRNGWLVFVYCFGLATLSYIVHLIFIIWHENTIYFLLDLAWFGLFSPPAKCINRDGRWLG